MESTPFGSLQRLQITPNKQRAVGVRTRAIGISQDMARESRRIGCRALLLTRDRRPVYGDGIGVHVDFVRGRMDGPSSELHSAVALRPVRRVRSHSKAG
jgi:hypothetical protein